MTAQKVAAKGCEALLAWRGAQRVVLVAGMIRSGSTWLYNTVRMVCAIGASTQGCWIDDFDPSSLSMEKWLVVKAHIPDPRIAQRSDFIITCHRDLRDVAASALDMGWSASKAEVLELVASARSCDEFWSPMANLSIGYGDIAGQPAYAVAHIAESLSVEISPDEIRDIVTKVSQLKQPVDTGAYDKVTLLHSAHRFDGRSGRWRNTLDPTLASAIGTEHCDWLSRRRYPQV